MRAILGTPDTPGSSYILVLRGIDYESIDYFDHHRKTYPTWGCLLFPEKGQISLDAESFMGTIHRLFASLSYSRFSDSELLKHVKEAFPPYSEEDDDPVVEYEPEESSKVSAVTEPSGIFNFHSKGEATAHNVFILGKEKVREHLVHTLKGNILHQLADDSYWDIKEIAKPDGSIDIVVSLRVAPPEKTPTFERARPFEYLGRSFDMLKAAAASVTGVPLGDLYGRLHLDMGPEEKRDLGL